MEKIIQTKILKEKLSNKKEISNFITNLFDKLEIKYEKFTDENNVSYLIYRQVTIEGSMLQTLCLVKDGNISGVSQLNEENTFEYINNEIKLLYSNKFSKELKTVKNLLLISNGNISNAFKDKLSRNFNNLTIVYWGIDQIREKTVEYWEEYFLNNEPIIHEYLQNLKNEIEDISKELKILYYNKKVKNLWDIFVELQLQESKVETENTQVNYESSIGENSKSMLSELVSLKKIKNYKYKIDDILDEEKNVLIYGEMGSGKTTILKKIILNLIENYFGEKTEYSTNKIPVLIQADTLKNSDNSLVENIEYKIRKHTKFESLNALELLNDQKLIVFIDGLDEIIENNGESIFNKIKTFNKEFPKTQLIITSRPSTLLNIAKNYFEYRKFEILPLESHQIERLIEKWYPTSKHKDKLLNVLKKTALSSAIPKTPLAITLLAIIFEEDNEKIDELPANITELYTKFTEVFLGKWDKEHGVTSQDKYGIRSHLINHIAFFMHYKNLQHLTYEELLEILEKYRNKKKFIDISIEQLKENLLERNPLFVTLGNNFRFIHLSFQEYFASKGIEQKNEFVDNPKEFLIQSFFNSWWSNVILFFVGNKPDCPDLISELSKNTIIENSYMAYLKIDILGRVMQAAITTDNDYKVLGAKSALRSLDKFRNMFRNEITNDPELRKSLSRLKLNDLYIICLSKLIFCNSLNSKHLKSALEEIFIEYKTNNKSDLLYYSTAYTLSEISGDPSYLLDFLNSDNVELEWKYIGFGELKKYKNFKYKFSKEQLSIIKSVKKKMKKGIKYIIFELKKLNRLPSNKLTSKEIKVD